MPTYQYRCASCGAEFDHWRWSAERDAPLACPACGAPAARVPVLPGGVCIYVPRSFRRHVDTTGLKDELGSGPGLDVCRPRWNQA